MIYLLDTNAVIKMLYGRHMSYALKALYAQKIQVVYHGDILREYVAVAKRLKEYVPEERATAFFVLLQEYGLEVTELGRSPILTDRDDEIFVQTINAPELSGTAVTLVTDNQKDFKNAKGITMISFYKFTVIVRKL